METISIKTSFVSNFTQIAWVVKDISDTERFFREGEKAVQKMKKGNN